MKAAHRGLLGSEKLYNVVCKKLMVELLAIEGGQKDVQWGSEI